MSGVHTSRSALLVMDLQVRVVGMLTDSANLIHEVANTVKSARAAKIPVVYIVVGFRDGFPEISGRNRSFSEIARAGTPFLRADPSAQIHPGVGWQEGDIIVTKRRVSAFTGSDLEVVLRSLEVTNLVLSGIATSGVVLSTLREAADKDYGLTVLSNCCGDMDEEVHRVLTTKVFPRQAKVTMARAWAEVQSGA